MTILGGGKGINSIGNIFKKAKTIGFIVGIREQFPRGTQLKRTILS